MNVYTIERPDAHGARNIALAVYREILDAHPWPFPHEPSESVLERFSCANADDDLAACSEILSTQFCQTTSR